ncbi:MAG: hypothetical protein FWH12_06710 [Treponema sp.]|nr:hypothetical protein [Treponema sp.]
MAQGGQIPFEQDPEAFIGLTLEELFSRMGTPRYVYPVRGLEEWQDDVVFVYDQGDMYIFRDRIWQIGFNSHRGISIGDTWGTAVMILGQQAEGRGNSVFLPIHDRPWPLMLRLDFDINNRVQAMYVYRTDV